MKPAERHMSSSLPRPCWGNMGLCFHHLAQHVLPGWACSGFVSPDRTTSREPGLASPPRCCQHLPSSQREGLAKAFLESR